MSPQIPNTVFMVLTLVCWAFLLATCGIAIASSATRGRVGGAIEGGGGGGGGGLEGGGGGLEGGGGGGGLEGGGGGGGLSYMDRYRDFLDGQTLQLAWAVALVATLGSLIYSEAVGFVPCRYCWFQRIGIYPLVIILGIAVVTRDRNVRKYVLGLNIPTALLSVYHVLLQRIPSLEGASSCDPANPCSMIYVNQLGIITIPVMALTTSVTIAVLMLLTRPEPVDAEWPELEEE